MEGVQQSNLSQTAQPSIKIDDVSIGYAQKICQEGMQLSCRALPSQRKVLGSIEA